MDKWTKAGLTFVILLMALSTGWVVVQAGQQRALIPMREDLNIEPQGIATKGGICNISLEINAWFPAIINKLQLNQDITGLTTYVNGTTVNTANPLQIKLNEGDFIQVNFTMPCTEYSSICGITVFGISVFTNNAMYFRELSSPI